MLTGMLGYIKTHYVHVGYQKGVTVISHKQTEVLNLN